MVSQKSFGIYFNNDLRPRFTRATLPIQPIHVQPEEHLGVDQCEPFRGRHADEALLQCLRRHRPLVAHLHPIRQLRVFEPLAAFDPIPLLASAPAASRRAFGAQQATSTNGPPVRSFGEVVDACWKLHLLLYPVFTGTLSLSGFSTLPSFKGWSALLQKRLGSLSEIFRSGHQTEVICAKQC